jgi:hypothetical protein
VGDEIAAFRADTLGAAFDAEASPEPRLHDGGIGTRLAVRRERLEASSLEAAPPRDGIAAPRAFQSALTAECAVLGRE